MGRGANIYHPRSRQLIWRSLQAADQDHWHPRSTYRTTIALAKWTRREADWIDPARECLYHIIVANEAHLRRVLGAYVRYYKHSRTHLAIDKAVQRTGRVEIVPQLGGLHNSFVRI